MSSFPAVSPLLSGVGKKINYANKETLSGSKPFIQLTKFAHGQQTINYGTYKAFDLSQAQKYNERFPPVITGMSISHAGSMGAIRKATIQVKFASTHQLGQYKDFLLIGNSQLVSWGWMNKSTPTPPNSIKFAAGIVVNIGRWEEACARVDFEMDFMAGPLINFDLKVNADGTVDANLEIGSPSEIPGFLALHSKGKKTSTEAKAEGDDIVKVCQGLDLDGNITGTTVDEIKYHTINFREDRIDKLSTWGESGDSYVQLGFALKAIVNKFRVKSENDTMLELGIDIDDSIAMGHPNMISVSENVLFPNKKTMGFEYDVDEDNARVLIPSFEARPVTVTYAQTAPGAYVPPITVTATAGGTQPFGPFNSHEFPEDNPYAMINGHYIAVSGRRAGYIQNIYVRIEFLKDAAKGCETVNDFLDKVIAELNVAGAGLYDLAKREIANGDKKLVYSIVDLNLEQDKIPTPTEIDLFSGDSRVIDISMNCDLPKAIVGMMVLHEDDSQVHDDNPGIRMFKMEKPDPVMEIAKPEKDEKGGKLDEPKNTEGTFTKAWKGFKNFFGGKIPTWWANSFNLPGENRVKFAASAKFGDGGKHPMFGVFKDVSCVKEIYFGKGYERKNALIPITISFTIFGLSGITIGSAIGFKQSPVPWLDRTSGYWQVTSVEHKVDDINWTTIVECKFRVTGTAPK
jgi:hypothetical protein